MKIPQNINGTAKETVNRKKMTEHAHKPST